ncbi:MAG: DNA/RNA non-specific endonuclease [Flavobacteriaceae bacterium]|nr:DNA/RNA non-specific endonuclease [Flavobacteriaceae bacterium]
MGKQKKIYTLLLAICIVGFWVFENFYTPASYSKEGGSEGIPFDAGLLPESTTNSVVAHQYYMLSYNEPFEQAEWVAYSLSRDQLTDDDRRRPYFIEDPEVRTKSADWRNYKGSGFDRGHLCPAGDRRFSEQAYNETFYTSNISPQRSDFNAGVWNRLEQQVRYWAKRYGQVHVVTAGVLEAGLDEIGGEDVAVPEAFYKIVYREDGDKAHVLAFLIPHEESPAPLSSFLVSVDALEAETGIDFFNSKPTDWQKRLEGQVRKSEWSF